MSTVVDLFVLYKILRKFVTPFTSMPAFKASLIDSNGNFLKSRDEMSVDEKRIMTYLDVFAINMKKVLGKIPGGKSQIATFAAALLFLRQKPIKEDVDDFDDMNLEQLEIDLIEIMEQLEEEGMAAGSGAIAGIGVGPKGEPGVTPKQMKRYKNKNKKGAGTILALMKRNRLTS